MATLAHRAVTSASTAPPRASSMPASRAARAPASVAGVRPPELTVRARATGSSRGRPFAGEARSLARSARVDFNQAVPGKVRDERRHRLEGGALGNQKYRRRSACGDGARRPARAARLFSRISGPIPAGSPWVRARIAGFTPRRSRARSPSVRILPESGRAYPPASRTPTPRRGGAGCDAALLPCRCTDVVLWNEQIRTGGAVELDGALVVPLDPAAQLLVVGQHDDHRRACRHLLEVVELLGVGLLRRGQFATGHGARLVPRLSEMSGRISLRWLIRLLSPAGRPSGVWCPCTGRLRRRGSTAAARTDRRFSTD